MQEPGMRVIVTRPENSGRRTALRLEELGHQPVILPLSSPSHDPPAALRALARPHSSIAVTSAEAIRCLAKLGPALAPHLSTPVYTVGRMTAAAARDIGFDTVTPSLGGGAELAELIADAQAGEIAEAPILYLAGTPRAPIFENRLEALGRNVVTAECYHMLTVDHEASLLHRLLVDVPVDAVLFYSRENVERFFYLPVVIDDHFPLKDTRFLCLSGNVSEAIPADIRHNARIAATPDEDALLALL